MQKQLQKTLSQIPMFSKMGKYISNKILKYNKKANTRRDYSKGCPLPEEYLKIKKQFSEKPYRHQFQRNSDKMYMTQPPVGYYQVNHTQIEKNPRTYNFDRSVPHFYREKFHCHENSPVKKDYPDISTSKPKVRGRVELNRTPGRQNIKGSIRKNIEDPHEKRFQRLEEYKVIIQNGKKRAEKLIDGKIMKYGNRSIDFNKILKRDNRMFKNAEFAPEYNIKGDHNPCRLDTHLIPFERMPARDENHMILKSGISDCFNQSERVTDRKATDWRHILPRQKTGILPSYMDKNINTRSSIGLSNLKSLEMNSADMKKIPEKMPKKIRKKMQFIEQNCVGKQNILRNSVH